MWINMLCNEDLAFYSWAVHVLSTYYLHNNLNNGCKQYEASEK